MTIRSAGALPTKAKWTDITGKPLTYPPSAHQHPQSDITGLAAALALLATKQELTDRINALLNGAPAALDTLKEIADRFASEDTEQEAMLATLASRLRFDAAQTLTGAQQAQGRSNLGVDLAALATQRQVLEYAGTDLTWTYPSPFAASVVPVIEGIVEAPANTTALLNAQIIGRPTNVSCKFRVNTIPTGSVGVSGLVNLTLFQQAAAGVRIHATARNP
jgi:hypothetical protein